MAELDQIKEAANLIKLNKSRDFGVCFPPENNVHFHQDGFYFDAKGNLCLHMLDEEATKRLRRLAVIRAADVAAEEAREKRLQELGASPEDIAASKAESAQPAVGNGVDAENSVDLVGWAKGEKKYSFLKIPVAFRDQYSVATINTKEDAINWLVENGKIAEDQVKI